MKVPRNINITETQLESIISSIKQNPTWLLKIPQVVHALAKFRRETAQGEYSIYTGDSEKVHSHAIDHNLSQLSKDTALDRSLALIYPLTAISKIWREAATLKALCIGPRSEAEIFHMVGHGWNPDNVSAIDLISYSEFVQEADMHEIPHKDNTFDVVIMGWVLAYSSDNALAAAEAMRVLKPGGYCAVGCVREPSDEDVELAASQVVGGLPIASPMGDNIKVVHRYYNMGQLKRLFSSYIENIVFDNDPIEEYDNKQDNVILVFRKKLDAQYKRTECSPSASGGYPPIRNLWDPA